MDGTTLYILRCADGKLYTGLTPRGVDEWVSEHQQGLAGFTRRRRPVTLTVSEHHPLITAAIDAERRIKGWTRAKKLASVAGDFDRLSVLAKRGGGKAAESSNARQPHGEEPRSGVSNHEVPRCRLLEPSWFETRLWRCSP